MSQPEATLASTAADSKSWGTSPTVEQSCASLGKVVGGGCSDLTLAASTVEVIVTDLTDAAIPPSDRAMETERTALALRTYAVQPGDELRTIAEKFGLRNETVIWANDLANPDLLRAGTELVILPVDGVLYQVQPGDTVAEVATYYGADLAAVVEANALQPPFVITVGERLLVPGGKMPIPTVQPAQVSAGEPAADSEGTPDAVQSAPDSQPVEEAEAEPAKPLPIPPSSTESQAAFILGIVDAARVSQRETGVPASVTIAQAILETYWGSSRLAREANNYFGIKANKHPGSAGVVRYNVWEHINGRDVVQNEPFRAYEHLTDSFVDHGMFFVQNPRYARAMANATDPRVFAHLIAEAGYATDPAYGGKVIALMDRFNLYAYDLP